jgi:hypothetical protein
MENNFIAKTSRTKGKRVFKIIEKEPFSKGCSRLAFKALIV